MRPFRIKILVTASVFFLMASGEVTPQEPTRIVRRSPPFALGAEPRHRVTIEWTWIEQKVVWPTGSGSMRGLESWIIRDALGTTLAREDLDPRAGHEEAWASLVKGARRTFLLLGFSFYMSAPGTGTYYLIFGFDRSQKLRKVGEFHQVGRGLLNRLDAEGHVLLSEGRYVEIGESMNCYFEMTFRYEYDEAREAFVARNRCGPPEGLFLRERPPGQYTVSLFARPDSKVPQQEVKVTSSARLEFPEACVDTPPPTVECVGANPLAEGADRRQKRLDSPGRFLASRPWVRKLSSAR